MRVAAIALLVGSLCVAACDDSGDLNLVPSAFGTFVLVTVDGNALPAVIVDSVSPPLTIRALSGNIVLNANNTFSDLARLEQTAGGIITTSTRSCTGTWSSIGNTLTFVEASTTNCGRTFTAILNGNTLAASILGVPATFLR